MERDVLAQKVISLIEPITNFHGAELVRVKIMGSLSKPTIQIMAERPNATMDLTLCETLSREYSLILDVEDIVKSEYTLEVSSPGIDRPLTRYKDFLRWYGFEATVELNEKYQNRRRLKGIVQKPDECHNNKIADFIVTIHEDAGIFEIPFSKIHEAKLTLTDELLQVTQNGVRLHGFAYDDENVNTLANVEIEVDDTDKIKKMSHNHKPRKIEEIEEAITLKCEGK